MSNTKDYMTTFWGGQNPRQELYRRLWDQLIPSYGHSHTIEGECLRAFAKIEHDAYNNGGGNNHSGSLLFLREHFPGFKEEWYAALREYICEGRSDDRIHQTIREIGEAVVSHVEATEMTPTPNTGNLAVTDLTVEYLGIDGPTDKPADRFYSYENNEDEEETYRFR